MEPNTQTDTANLDMLEKLALVEGAPAVAPELPEDGQTYDGSDDKEVRFEQTAEEIGDESETVA